ncbi:PD-(D/E)XK nuclease domain-containing protein [Blastococcus sp. SYSU DS0616]
MTDDVERRLAGCLRMAEALLEGMDAATRTSDPKDVWRFSSYREYMRKYNQVLDAVVAVEAVDAPVDRYNLDVVRTNMDTLAMQQQAYFESVRGNLLILRAYLHNRVNPRSERVSEIADFLQANLRRATLRAPERERDVQDVIEQLFIGRGLEKGSDYDREVGRVKVSTKEVIPDFVLLKLETAIEVKLAKDPGRLSSIVDEINADIQAYGIAYPATVFVVYDAGGAIRDEAEFRRDLEAVDGVKVVVVKH